MQNPNPNMNNNMAYPGMGGLQQPGPNQGGYKPTMPGQGFPPPSM